MDINFFENFFSKTLNLEAKEFSEVSTDTRSVKAGSLFIALKGENFDGNTFVEEALNKGAVAVVTSNESFKDHENCVYVTDSLRAMQKLGRAWQDFVDPKVLAITGSNGKTTAKFFTNQLIHKFKKTSFSPKSFNNNIGVPFTQLNLKKGDEVLISEIGTNNPGEIEELTKMVSPHAAVVTTVGPSHIERFGTEENIAVEKSQIYRHSIRLEAFIFNLDNKYTSKLHEEFRETKNKMITFSTTAKNADVCLSGEQVGISNLHVKGTVFGVNVDLELPLFGEHHVYNIMTALCFGHYLDIKTEDMISELQNLQTPWGRCQVFNTKEKGSVLFDAYNANLQSNKALLASAKKIQMKQPQIILGEMFELGEQAKEMHFELGRLVGAMDFEMICFIGESMSSFSNGVRSSNFGKNLVISSTYDQKLAIDLGNVLNPSGTILMKGSRGIGLEKLLPLLLEEVTPL